VFADGPDKVYSCVLSEHLMCFCGIVAAGTRSGRVYLIGTPPAIHILSIVLLQFVDLLAVVESCAEIV